MSILRLLKNKLIVLSVFFISFSSYTQAQQILYAVNGAGGAPSYLYKLNATTGAVIATVGPTGFSHITGLAVHPTTGVIYAHVSDVNNGGVSLLLVLDPVSGAGTVVGNSGLQIPDMAFSPSGVLYTWVEYNSLTFTNDDDLYTMNLTTGAGTSLGNCISCPSTSATGLGVNSSGQIYMKSGSNLYQMSATGQVTSGPVALSSTTHNMLAFDANNVLYSGQRNGSSFILKTINPTTGTVTTVGTSALSDISAICFGGTPLPCTGTPDAGTASAPGSVCPNVPFTIMSSGSTFASGITYQWQSSPASLNTWTNITGATSPFYSVTTGLATATDYRMILNCTPSGLSDTSNEVSVGLTPFYTCYCSPNTGTTLVSSPYNLITSTLIPGTTLYYPSGSVPTNGYTLVPTTPSSNTASLNISQQYTFVANINPTTDDAALWIDYNQSGTFDATEKTPLAINYSTNTATGVFVIPTSSTAGLTGLRVTARDGGTITLPCNGITYGEVEDYAITLVLLPACTGTPNAGSATASATTVCPNIPINLSLTGSSASSGLIYQWQSKPSSSSTWTDITGATNMYYTVAGQTVATDYRATVTCNSITSNSTPVSVGQNSFYNCYCSPNTGTTLVSSPQNLITNTTIPTTTLSHASSTVPANGYTLVPSTPASNTASMNIGQQYTFTASIVSWTDEVALWIDYNQTGTFDATEKIPLTINYTNYTANGTFIIPGTASAGLTGMRVTARDGGSAISLPCSSVFYGEVEDYAVTLVLLPACTGTPVAGTAVASVSSVCPNTPINLSITGNTQASGLSYQWQTKLTAASTWNNIVGATNMYYTVISQTAASDYRVVVSCGTNSDNSVVVSVAQNSFYTCYCSPNNSTTTIVGWPENLITNVSIPTTTLNRSSTTVPVNGYELIPATPASNTASLNISQPYTFTANVYSWTDDIALWIDYNQSGTFDVSEKIPLTINFSNYTASGTFIIPATALAGVTGMRVIGSEYQINLPCNYISYGEIEDYSVTLVTLPACTGTPNAGTATASVTSVCPNIPFSLSLTGSSASSGLTYQWQSKPSSSSTWTNITGATTLYYTITGQAVASDYRAVVSCGSNTANSVAVTVGQNSFYTCYCSPANSTTSFVYGPENLITNVSIPTTTLNRFSSSVTPTGYELVPSTPVSNTASLNITQQYNFVAAVSPWTYDISLWIDYNQSGTFDVAEEIPLTIDFTNNTATGTFTIPATAIAGMTGMRVIASENSFSGPCDYIYYGEIEDYSITLVSLPPCSGTPNAGIAVSTAGSVCANTPFTLSLSGSTAATGLSYQWQTKLTSASAWNNIPGATSITYTVNSQVDASDYRAVVYCAANSANSNPVSVAQNSFYQCYCSPLTGTTLIIYPDNYVGNVTILTTTLNHTSTTTPANGYTFTPPTPSFNTASLDAGTAYTIQISLNYWLDDVALWIDYNQSGTFDIAEKIPVTINFSTGIASATFIVPVSAPSGLTGMRVTASYSGIIFDPCSYIYDGEVEDYNITINGPCAAPVLLAPTNVTPVSATLNWMPVSNANNYEYVVSQNATPPTGAGTAITGLTYTAPGLSSLTAYYFFLRAACGTNNIYSPWSSQFFTTANEGVNNVNSDGFTVNIFPNPANDKVIVKVAGKIAGIATITLLDITGKVIKTIDTKEKETSIDFSDLANGMYLLKYNDSRHTQTTRVTKQ